MFLHNWPLIVGCIFYVVTELRMFVAEAMHGRKLYSAVGDGQMYNLDIALPVQPITAVEYGGFRYSD